MPTPNCRDCQIPSIHKNGRCLNCHRALNAAYMRKHREANRAKCRKQDRERKKEQRVENTAYAERQRARKRRQDIKEKRNATRRTPEARRKQQAYQQVYRKREHAQLRARARVAVQHAIARGDLVRPSICEDCGSTPGRAADGRSLIRADHFMGYDKTNYLNVQWVCTTCDGSRERERRVDTKTNPPPQ
jgi:hypothetical protein